MQFRQEPEEDRAAIMAGMILLLLSATTAVCAIVAAFIAIRKVVPF